MKITGISYYPTSIAQTNRAQAALSDQANKMGYKFYEVTGHKSRFDKIKIHRADVIIIAVNMDVLREDTFNGKKIIYAGEEACIDHPEKVLALAGVTAEAEENGHHLWGSFKKRALAWQ